MASVKDIAPIMQAETDEEADWVDERSVASLPGNVEQEVLKLGQTIQESSSLGLQAATQTVIGNIPEMIRELTDDIKSGSIDNFSTAMNKLIKLVSIFTFTLFSYANAEVKMGVEGGLGYADMRAEETAQTLANLSGSTVTYTYDEATWMGRIFADYAFSPEISTEIGYFITGSLDATYTISGASATESYDAMGLDAAVVVHQDAAYFKAGMHSSELNGAASLSIDGTTYNVSETISGTGYLVGAGLEVDGTRYGLTYYADLGGDGDSGMVFLYGGITF